MGINRDNFKQHFLIADVNYFSTPAWNCPYCDIGILSTNIDKILFETINKDEPDYIELQNIAGLLLCNNPRCGKSISFAGHLRHEIVETKVTEENPAGMKEISYFVPLYFHPFIPIFTIKSFYPKGIGYLLEEAFSLFWCDTKASANKIRNVIELILSNHKIERKKHTLHARINKFKKTNPAVSDYFMAIKWIGNAGSHIGKLTCNDLLDGFELLETTLRLLYDRTEVKIIKIKDKINKKKKPLSHKR